MSAAPASGALSRRGQAAAAGQVDVNSPDGLFDRLMVNMGSSVARRVVEQAPFASHDELLAMSASAPRRIGCVISVRAQS